MAVNTLHDNVKNDLFCNMISDGGNWSDRMCNFGYSRNKMIIDKFVKHYHAVFANNLRLRKELNVCDVDCLVCTIKCQYYISKKEKLSILPCKEICRRSLYNTAMNSMMDIIHKMYDNHKTIYQKGISINNTDLFIYIPNNIRTDMEIRRWLDSISWRKNCLLEHVSKKPGFYPKTTSILYKWIIT